MNKTCKGCGHIKTLDQFSKKKDSLQPCCKCCVKIKNKDYYEKNKAAIIKSNNEYYLKNREHLNEQKKIWHLNNQEKVKEYKKKYEIENKAKLGAAKKRWHDKKMETDPGYKVTRYLRSRIWNALKGRTKSASTMDLAGCSLEKLKTHLEKQFTQGMKWENYGSWHIDHIRPCESFDMSNVEHQRVCFHFTNLQPLWAKDNLRKGSKINLTNTTNT